MRRSRDSQVAKVLHNCSKLPGLVRSGVREGRHEALHMKWVGGSLEQRDWVPELVILREVGKLLKLLLLLEDPNLTSTTKTQTNIATSTQTNMATST